MKNWTIPEDAIARVTERARDRFAAAHPKSKALAERAKASLFDGVPMHWMADWPTPFPLFVARANGARFKDVDGNEYVDFCLGDTGTMFGHSPPAVADAIREQAGRGYTTMLPSEDAVWVGDELARRFGLPFWQVAATATDANRYALRWARAVTGREKILVFDGCYHGTVEETMVRLQDGKTVPRPGQLGNIADVARTTRVVEFNDLAALEKTLAPGEIAAVLAEPAMTNIGMVLPDPGFHDALRTLTRKYGTLLIIDETHTISTGPGGYTKAFDLKPDMFVLGKPVAGGIPCAVFGFTADVATRMEAARTAASAGGHGHSGMGTTLSANAFAMHAMRANLAHVMTDAAYAHMTSLAEHLSANLHSLITKHQLPWVTTQIGARTEFQFCAKPPRTGREAEAAFHDELEKCIHLALLNRGVMITPFHNMILVCPQTTADDVDRLLRALDETIGELRNA
ncbi:MAG: aspartate aminotransferase family protein [Alphaproteobacteria bacterium]|nr:aspartate aminotransferase family protein [Alphaproteobacteria bacterium]